MGRWHWHAADVLTRPERLADQMSADPETNPGLQYNCACDYARILAIAADRSQPSAASALSPEGLTARAMASLRKHFSAKPSLDAHIIRDFRPTPTSSRCPSSPCSRCS